MVKYEITDSLATLSEMGKRSVRLNLVRWNDAPRPSLEIRIWYQSEPEGILPGKGIILHDSEALSLLEALQRYFHEDSSKE